jgi:multiple sugar transport system ATP-binding protein
MTKVVLNGLTKVFGNVVAVNNITMTIEHGKFVCLLGPSGCGKTTTLRMIAGLETPTSGEIYFDDQLINDVPTEKRDVAMVFQFYALYPNMTVYDTIAFPLKQIKMPRDEIKRRVRDVGERLKLVNVFNLKTDTLNTEEKQRVALARAIVRTPRVYLFDEPLTNLDAKLRVLMRGELKRLQRELGQTVIYVTHDQIEAMTMADRIAVMEGGRLMQYDEPKRLYNKPKNIFVAGFIGSPPMNFMDGTFMRRDDEAFLDFGFFKLDVTELQDIIVRTNKTEFILGVRPTDLAINEHEGIDATVLNVENLGDKGFVDVKIGDYVLKASIPPFKRLDVGTKVKIRINTNMVHIFDRSTGEAIV